MKLESVIKQIVSEAVTPVQFLMKAIKSLGKGAVEAENALIRAIRKEGNLGPKVAVDVNNVTEELMQRAVKNVEFAAYRKLIAQKLYNKNQQLFDDIILNSSGKTRVLQLNNAGIPPAFQEEVRNLSKLKNRTIKQTPTTTPSSTPIANPYDALKPVVIDQQSKDAFVQIMNEKGVKIKPQHLDKVMLEVQKSVNAEVGKLENLFNDPTFVKTITSFNKLPIDKQNEIVTKAIQAVKKTYGDYLLGLKISEKTKKNLQSTYNASVDAFYLGMRKKGQKFDMGNFMKWWMRSISVTWGLFFASIYAEAMRKENEGFTETLSFAWEKVKQAPERFLISLVPGVNLIVSGGNLVFQTITSGVVIAYRKLTGTTQPKPGESGLFNNNSGTTNSSEDDPAGINHN